MVVAAVEVAAVVAEVTVDTTNRGMVTTRSIPRTAVDITIVVGTAVVIVAVVNTIIVGSC